MIHTAKNFIITAETESPVAFATWKSGLMAIERQKTDKEKSCLIVAHGIHEVEPNITFRRLATNFSKQPIILHKNTVIATGSKPPEWIVKCRQLNIE